ncbi:MAG: UDP-N-acetylglucosamine--N-acetylmuramyl-(pentapeptide) pyrophosphoryl-undecaprenol N-acetylglucosamine transferase [Candidatus Harrisonbacteria bacterium]|nr:UDP-N-acetylglucosamine--N-acetylmuramyl-(pentapeptide) pyrophosphoryl-undecaprenol N-acetylglucosamine transferase [Candidatus Harrisonbacteria bacterium]
MKKLRVLLAGGGTGGHIYPLIAVAGELKTLAEPYGITLDMRYFGSARGYAEDIINSDIDFVPIISSKLRRYWTPLNLIDIPKFFLSLIQLLWKLFWFMPDVVFSKGGPGALAIILVSRFYLIPVVIHESDTIPGLTNSISGKLAKKIFLAFASTDEYFPKKDVEVIGNPVREFLFQQIADLEPAGDKALAEAKKLLGFDSSQPLLLIIGGSQGAERLNNFVLESLEVFIKDFQILHQVGITNYDNYKKEFEFLAKDWDENLKKRYHFVPFFQDNMGIALTAADFAISRSGAGSIFELAAFGKPAILIPLPESANDHQRENAYNYAHIGAAIVIEEANLLSHLIMDELNKLFKNPELLQKMSDAARSFYRPDAATIIAKYLLTFIS